MMTLTPDQTKLLESGSAVTLTVDQTMCVLVRKDVFDKMIALEYDDSDWTDDEMSRLAERTLDQSDRAERIP
ncbi:MAG TPA: hypothetical protein PKC18_06130 [Lacipirellulaceae bacterium]|nr:hypothetical protein [Lacipirellulaceae bacterium]HMP05427.1 hypothetical protein [Lacipirellulaceae bacterium]